MWVQAGEGLALIREVETGRTSLPSSPDQKLLSRDPCRCPWRTGGERVGRQGRPSGWLRWKEKQVQGAVRKQGKKQGSEGHATSWT